MFKEVKNTINDLAYMAVIYADKKLTTSSGKEKKKTAVNYILNRLNLPSVLKPFLGLFFSKFIDRAIEKSVAYMKQIKNED